MQRLFYTAHGMNSASATSSAAMFFAILLFTLASIAALQGGIDCGTGGVHFN
jgi:hypothetical protein